MFGLFYPYGIVLQAIALLHFVRRRPDMYWLWIILMGGGLGALVYIVIEVVPDVGLLRGAFQVFPRRKRIKELEGLIIDNPSVGNYEELGDLYLDDGQFARARECFDRVIAKSGRDRPALPPRVVRAGAGRFHRRGRRSRAGRGARPQIRLPARGRPARARAGQARRGATRPTPCSGGAGRPRRSRKPSTTTPASSPATGRAAEAREWAERILRKKATMPDYIRRRERPWFRKTAALLKRIR